MRAWQFGPETWSRKRPGNDRRRASTGRARRRCGALAPTPRGRFGGSEYAGLCGGAGDARSGRLRRPNWALRRGDPRRLARREAARQVRLVSLPEFRQRSSPFRKANSDIGPLYASALAAAPFPATRSPRTATPRPLHHHDRPNHLRLHSFPPNLLLHHLLSDFSPLPRSICCPIPHPPASTPGLPHINGGSRLGVEPNLSRGWAAGWFAQGNNHLETTT